jgi:excisionase family DNA binding protein
MNSVASDSDMMTVREVSEILRVHPTTVYKLAQEGRLPSFRVGTAWRFHKDLIARWMVDGSGAVEMSEVPDPFSKSQHRTFEHKLPARPTGR